MTGPVSSPRSPNPVFQIIRVRGGQATVLGLLLHWLCHWPLTGPHALGLFLTPLLCLYFVFTFVTPWAWGLPITTRTSGDGIALTFDDGPSPETTPSVLDLLDRHAIKATFFVLGDAAARHPDLVRRLVEQGHTVGVHAFDHNALVLTPWPEVLRQIRRTSGAVHRACPEAPPPRWFRPPFGFKTLVMPFLAHRAGCRMAGWSVDSRDYRSASGAEIAATVLSHVHPGAIVLLHDGPENRATVTALPQILTELVRRGYQFVTLP